jgi:5'-3' exonuclease
MKILSPETDLKIKIIIGDPGDNIPSIGKRIGKKIGPVGAAKMLKNIDKEFEDKNVFEAYALNRTLIDFSCIPKEVETAILEEYNGYTVGKYNGRNMYKYLVERDMSKNLENLQDFNRVFGEIS